MGGVRGRADGLSRGPSMVRPAVAYARKGVLLVLSVHLRIKTKGSRVADLSILVEGAIALPVTLSGGALFAS